jgi:hypothetical protein
MITVGDDSACVDLYGRDCLFEVQLNNVAFFCCALLRLVLVFNILFIYVLFSHA